MPRIIQILDCDSAGHKVRMDDGEFAFLPHDAACVPCIGEELAFDREAGRWSAVEGGLPHMNSGAESKPKGSVEPEQAPAPEDFDSLTEYERAVKKGLIPAHEDAPREEDRSSLIAAIKAFGELEADGLLKDHSFSDHVKERLASLAVIREGNNAVDTCGGLREGSQGEDPKATPPVV